MRCEKAGLLAPRSSYSPCLTVRKHSGTKGFCARYSGATVRDLHPFPYPPLAVTKGTFPQKTTKCSGAIKELR